RRHRQRTDPRPGARARAARRHRSHPARPHQARRASPADRCRAAHRHGRPDPLPLTRTTSPERRSTPMAGPSLDPSLYRDRDLVRVKRALVSVSDKSGLIELAEALTEAGIEIVSTGSTAQTIRDAGHQVTDVASVTGV